MEKKASNNHLPSCPYCGSLLQYPLLHTGAGIPESRQLTLRYLQQRLTMGVNGVRRIHAVCQNCGYLSYVERLEDLLQMPCWKCGTIYYLSNDGNEWISPIETFRPTPEQKRLRTEQLFQQLQEVISEMKNDPLRGKVILKLWLNTHYVPLHRYNLIEYLYKENHTELANEIKRIFNEIA